MQAGVLARVADALLAVQAEVLAGAAAALPAGVLAGAQAGAVFF